MGSIIGENIKLSLLKHLNSDDYKIKTINTFASEELKLEGIKQLQSEFRKEDIIKTLTDIKIIAKFTDFFANSDEIPFSMEISEKIKTEVENYFKRKTRAVKEF